MSYIPPLDFKFPKLVVCLRSAGARLASDVVHLRTRFVLQKRRMFRTQLDVGEGTFFLL